ncbi:MAG: hypothetical protein KDD41_13555 [Flavobacteriales bacterium]|nr:hypothetical protein [Flavobacteriales bacterium]
MDAATISELSIDFLIAAVKFVVAAGFLVFSSSNFSYLEIIITLIAGGTTGFFVFYFFSNWINLQINKLIRSKKKKRKSTKNLRRFITIKNKYGLIGISILTPVVFSIPVGSFLASRFFRHHKLTFPIMISGIVFWSIVLPLIKLYN